MPPNGYAMLRDDFDAIFIGALGDPRVPDNRHARDILLGTRFELDLYVNYRPGAAARRAPVPAEGPRRRATSISWSFRENTEGLYVGIGGRFKAGTDDEVGDPGGDQHLQRRAPDHQLRLRVREARTAAHASAWPTRATPCRTGTRCGSACSGRWRAQYPGIEARHLYIDALALLMVQNPAQFEVIVTNNLFGDIITDLGAALQGGLGMAASGNLHPGRTSMFEPVHGSAPPLAGKNVANPIGAILSAALMLEYLGLQERSRGDRSGGASRRWSTRQGTAEIGGTLGTRETGDYIASAIEHRKRSREDTDERTRQLHSCRVFFVRLFVTS